MNDEISAARRRKRARYHIRRLGIFVGLLVVLFVGVLIANAVTQTTFRDIADIASTVFAGRGGYPAPLGSSRPIKVCSLSMSYAVLTDDELIIQSGRGERLLTAAHGLVDADIEAAGNRVALYNIGSRDVTVYNRTREIAAFSTEQPIVDGAVGGDGTVVLLTRSERYFCQLEVFGNGMYEKSMTWYGSSGFPLACRVSDSGSRAAVGCIDADGGALITEVTLIDLAGRTQLWTARIHGLLLDMAVASDGSVVAVTDEGVYALTSDGAVHAARDFLGVPVLYIAFDGMQPVIAFGDNNQPSVNYLVIYDSNLDERGVVNGCGRIRDICPAGGSIYTLDDGEIRRYDRSGEHKDSYPADRDAFRLIDYNGILELRPDEAVRMADAQEDPVT